MKVNLRLGQHTIGAWQFPSLCLVLVALLSRTAHCNVKLPSYLRSSAQYPGDCGFYNALCSGPWQMKYTQQHKQMLARPLPEQRLVVFDAVRSGFSDRMFSTITAFYFALLTGRAFKIRWHGKWPLEVAYASQHVNWTLAESDIEENTTLILNYYYTQDKRELEHMYSRTNFSELHPSSRTILFTNNQGQLHRLFQNPFYKTRLERWGLRPETAFGCAYHYLFRPTPQVLRIVHTYDNTLTRCAPNPKTIVIGIQVRLGDQSFGKEGNCDSSIDSANAVPYFACASMLEEDLGLDPSFRVLWFLATDCQGLRRSALKRYKGKVITDASAALDHSFDTRTGNVHAYLTAFAESWILSHADYHVLTYESSFGRFPAWASLRSNNIFVVHPGVIRNCRSHDYDTFKDVSSQYTKV